MIEYREMTIEDYDAVLAVWKESQRLRISQADSRNSIAAYLQRNLALSLVALDGAQIVGTILAGHDGRRGYMHHVVVLRSWRRQGIGSEMAQRCLEKFRTLGIDLCHVFVRDTNADGRAFWNACGWSVRNDIGVMSMELDGRDEVACLSIT